MTTRRANEIMERAAYLAGVVLAPDGRHTVDRALELTNTALERYHSDKNAAGHPHEVTRTTATTSSSETVTLGWPLNSYVVLPSDFLQLLGVTLQTTSNSVRTLNPFTEGMNELLWTQWPPATGVPEWYRIANASDGTRILRLLPAAAAAYDLELVYLPAFTPLYEEQTYTFLHGTEDAVTCDVAMQMLEADGVQEGNQYQALMRRRDEARALLARHSPRQARAGVATPYNDRGARRIKARTGWRFGVS